LLPLIGVPNSGKEVKMIAPATEKRISSLDQFLGIRWLFESSSASVLMLPQVLTIYDVPYKVCIQQVETKPAVDKTNKSTSFLNFAEFVNQFAVNRKRSMMTYLF